MPGRRPEYLDAALTYRTSDIKVDAIRTGVLETVGPLGASLIAFDFAGSGLSDGDYVTLVYDTCLAQFVSA